MIRSALAVATVVLVTSAPVVHGQAYPTKPVRIINPLAAGRTPHDVLEKLRASVVKAVAVPELRNRFGERGIPLVASSSPDEFNAFLRKHVGDFAKLAKTTGIKAN
jgi:tripartite-type tricarboxylate transporter receptor subunit TctC